MRKRYYRVWPQKVVSVTVVQFDPNHTSSELGAGIVVGALVGVAIAIGQYALADRVRTVQERQDERQEASDRRHALAVARSNFRLTIGLRRQLRNLDLVGRDLSRFYLAPKDMSGVDLSVPIFAGRISSRHTWTVRALAAQTTAAVVRSFGVSTGALLRSSTRQRWCWLRRDGYGGRRLGLVRLT